MGSEFVNEAKACLTRGLPQLVFESPEKILEQNVVVDLQPRWHRFIMPPYLHPDVVASFLPFMTSITSGRHLGGSCVGSSNGIFCDECGDFHKEDYKFEVAFSSFTLTPKPRNREPAEGTGADEKEGMPQNAAVNFVFLRYEYSGDLYGGQVLCQ